MTVEQDRIKGCLVGGAIGDAAASGAEGALPASGQQQDSCYAVPEFWDKSQGIHPRIQALTNHWLDPSGWRISDDTQLTLATCEALSSGVVSAENIAAYLLRWYRQRRITGMGASTLKALRDLDAGCHWALAGRKGEFAAGNGAAMRIAPVAFCIDPRSRKGRELLRDVCRITHHHEEAYVGALALALAIRNSLASLEEIAEQLPDSIVRDRLQALHSLPEASIGEVARRFGSSGYVAHSVPLALYATTRLPRLGFQAMLGQIIRAGGDADTTASMACQIVGTGLGFSRLPQDLLERLPEKELIIPAIERFAERLTAGDWPPGS